MIKVLSVNKIMLIKYPHTILLHSWAKQSMDSKKIKKKNSVNNK